MFRGPLSDAGQKSRELTTPPEPPVLVRYTVHDWEIHSKKDIKLFTEPSVKSPDELLGMNRLGA